MKRLAAVWCLLCAPALTFAQGVLPVGADGKPLNLDFETGTLKDWTAEGEAFAGQPIKGDTVFPRRSDNRSRHQGQYWIGGYEKLGDKPQGTLTSVPFKVTHPWASFLVGGGPHDVTCVELVKGDSKEVFLRASGLEEEDMRRVVVDLKGLMGKEMFIRIVDRHSGHWGHVNFDDFRFHTQKPDFPPRQASPDILKYAGLPPEKAAAAMTVPEGFEVKLFAGEPDVVQPIAMCLDDRGRLWVAEGHCYPKRRASRRKPDVSAPDSPFVADGVQGDRILIFEDTDGDGHFDKRTVFMEGLNLVSGLEVGFGGVWIGAAPYLLYVPMKDDKPAAEPKLLLDGWGWQDTHETLNAFTWGPDGWLYGCHGVFTHSNVGKPGTPADKRTKINAGVWRYHPTRHVFEVFAHGTSNPWGLAFNDVGQMFVSACVIPHCFHIIQGGRYQRQAGEHFNPYTYADIQTIADHLHWQGANPWAGNNRSDTSGGGHAHCGLMCYQGGAWPAKYHNQLFMGNIHGRRINMDEPRAKGSGYVAGHGPDFLMANDAWARFINMRSGPDGNVYVIDWYDKQACHTGDVKIWDRSNGRIYKVCYRGTKPAELGFGLGLENLAAWLLTTYQADKNAWHPTHARRLLQERCAQLKPGEVDKDLVMAEGILVDDLRKGKVGISRLRSLWTLHGMGKLTWDLVDKALQDKEPSIRGWAIQLAMEQPEKELIRVDQLVKLAEKDDSPVVRRYLASALQKMDYGDRERILVHLLKADDSKDPNLPLLYWYALEPLTGNADHRDNALKLVETSAMPQLLAFTVRRIASDATPEALDHVLKRLSTSDDAMSLVILREIRNGLKGRPQVKMPPAWPKTFARLAKSNHIEVRREAVALGVTFGDETAFVEMHRFLLRVEGSDATARRGT